MLIFGTKTIPQKTLRIKNETCQHCSKIDTTTYTVATEYFHIFWIPTFPLPKKYSVYCEFCRNIFVNDEIKPNLYLVIQAFSKQIKTPIYYWVGTLFIVFSIIINLIIK